MPNNFKFISKNIRIHKTSLSILKAMRLYQWVKNGLLFLPMLAAHDFSRIGTLIIAFLCFSLIASSTYLINDIFDIESDRRHPRKKYRPIASGNLSVSNGLTLSGVLLSVSFLISFIFLDTLFVYVTLSYVISTLSYSIFIKSKSLIDVFWLSCLYTLRILAGAAASNLPLSPWILGFSIFLFLALAAIKRTSELISLQAEGKPRAQGRDYELADLPILQGLSLATGNCSVLVMALYLNSETVAQLYRLPEALWTLCLLFLFWINRMVFVTHRGRMTDDPIVFAAQDKISILIAFLCLAALILAKFASLDL